MQQFLRKARVTFLGSGGFVVNPSDTVEAHELRVAFSGSKSVSGSANTFTVRVWNLNADHRNSIGEELDEIQLECGYVPTLGTGNLGVITQGAIRDVQHVRSGADIITEISCAEGDKVHRKAVISKTFSTGSEVQDVVQNIFESMEIHGVKRGEWKFPDNMRTFKRPYSICGGCVRELNVLGRSHGFYWSIQNNVLEVIPSDGSLPGQVLITPETGMVGTPTLTDNGVKIKCLVNPAIRVNRTVKIKSSVLEMNSQDDTFRVSELGFSGDNTQGEFIFTVHGESISDGTVNEGKLK